MLTSWDITSIYCNHKTVFQLSCSTLDQWTIIIRINNHLLCFILSHFHPKLRRKYIIDNKDCKEYRKRYLIGMALLKPKLSKKSSLMPKLSAITLWLLLYRKTSWGAKLSSSWTNSCLLNIMDRFICPNSYVLSFWSKMSTLFIKIFQELGSDLFSCLLLKYP